jgi:hypothetical protein
MVLREDICDIACYGNPFSISPILTYIYLEDCSSVIILLICLHQFGNWIYCVLGFYNKEFSVAVYSLELSLKGAKK